MYAHGLGDRVRANIPGGVTVVGDISGGPFVDSDGSVWWHVVDDTDRSRYDVREEEIDADDVLDYELADAKGRPDLTHPDNVKLLDVLASEARTALDDPAAVGLDVNDIDGQHAFAVTALDDIISLLNPAEETRASYAATLTILGKHLAERQDEIEQAELGYDGHDQATREAYQEAWGALKDALDCLDNAIAALVPEN